MVKPHSSNFRVITTNILGVRIFRKFTALAVLNTHLIQFILTVNFDIINRDMSKFLSYLNQYKSHVKQQTKNEF